MSESNITMSAKDTVSAKLAQCFATIGEKRYNFMQMIDFEAKFEKKKTKVPILGRTGAGNKSTGWEGTGKAKLHYNQSIFRQMMADFKNTGEDMYFTIQVTNDDPTSAAGKQIMLFYGCNIDGGALAKFDANGEYLDEDVNFTFEDFDVNKPFNLLSGMTS